MRPVKIIIIPLLFFILSAFTAQAALLNTNKTQELTNNINALANQTEYNTSTTLEGNIAMVIRIAMTFLGSIFIILVIFAGINWMRAGGNEEVIKKSKKTIMNLVIGLVIAIAAYALSSGISNILVSSLITR